MASFTLPVRETPAAALLLRDETDPAGRSVFEDNVILAIDNIQGSILTGFNKSHRLLVSLRVNDKGAGRVDAFKNWLYCQSHFVATATEVIAFSKLFKSTRDRRKSEGTVKSTWMGLSLSQRLLNVLVDDAKFADQAFTQGLAQRSKGLGDPTDGDFAPQNWHVGGPGKEADLLAMIEADDPHDLT